MTWFNGDIYRMPLTAAQTAGAIGMVEAVVPPGGGPVPHVHERSDETFYVIAGEAEFLLDSETFMVNPEDVVFVPRGVVHRFQNPGIRPATLLFVYTPGGPEGLFVEGGDTPIPGTQVQPWGPERIDERLLGLLAKYDPNAAGTETDPRYAAIYDIVTPDPASAWPDTENSPDYPRHLFDDPAKPAGRPGVPRLLRAHRIAGD